MKDGTKLTIGVVVACVVVVICFIRDEQQANKMPPGWTLMTDQFGNFAAAHGTNVSDIVATSFSKDSVVKTAWMFFEAEERRTNKPVWKPVNH